MIYRLVNKRPPLDSYTTPQVAEYVGIKQRKILSFIERGYIKPSIADADGHGSKREWSFDDVVRCAIVDALIKILSVNSTRKVMDTLNKVRTLDENSVIMLTTDEKGDGPGVWVLELESDNFEDIQEAHPVYLMIHVSGIIDRVLGSYMKTEE